MTVKIGQFRNQLSRYLKQVRQGVVITITDRDTPIGQVVPFSKNKKEKLTMIPATKGFSGLAHFRAPPTKLTVSVVDELMRDRSKR